MRIPRLAAILRPLTFGVALAYALTGFVDLPAPVRLGSEGVATAQGVVGGDDALLVAQRNVFRLGSPLSIRLYGDEERFESLVPQGNYGTWDVSDENGWSVRGWVEPE